MSSAVCCSCKKPLAGNGVWVPTKNPSIKLRVHQACEESYLARLKKRKPLVDEGTAGAYHQHDGRVIRGTNSC